MATIEEITARLKGLAPTSLETVRALVESLMEKDARAAAWSFDFLGNLREAAHSGTLRESKWRTPRAPA